ncbi:outer membrane protein assembly factor BamB family protein [Protaetiibacter intestinalis]|uniref:Pyrrolo-quinoline quinone repeat domain-containing protein n=1 Tax=Protaetiibacter intestinalis TaxID=2419774 RepID=A0A387B2C6_9MICO|nr:PQQ-binding-like beta-propeller repeat protein [Protaetiibacter intestinalis]AYF97652.1 hypothetical protein D7I47_04845 [Protaetiibacter intestinalis]
MSETTTVAAEPQEQTADRRAPSTLRRALVWTTIVGVVAAGTAGLAASDLVAPPSDGGRAARYVPADGAATLTTAADGTRAVHEHARGTGPGLLLELPASAAAGFFGEYPEAALRNMQLWRETITPIDDPDDVPTSTLYLLGDAGVSMLSVTGGQIGFAFSPALVMLPADAAPGAHWTGSGSAVPSGALGYTVSGEVAAGDAGCLLATTDTRYSEASSGEVLLAITETITWCPGRGAIRDVGTVNGDPVDYSSVELPAGGLGAAGLVTEPAPPDWADAADWRSRELSFVISDPAFGDSPQGMPFDGLAATTSDGTLVSAIGARLVAYTVDGTTATRTWKASPGGDLLALSAIGEVTLVSTSQRRLLAYDGRGARLWAVEFPDVVLSPPTAGPDGDILAVSLDGTLRRLDLATGETLWSTALRTDVEAPPAVGDGIVVVVDRGGTVIAHSLADGSERWRTRYDGAELVAAGEGVVVVQSSGADVWALDPANGAVRWDSEHRGVGRQLLVMSGVVVAQSDESAAAWAVDGDGTMLWSSDATEGLFGDGERFVLVGLSGLEVRTPDGEVLGEVELGEASIGVSRVVMPMPHGIRVLQSNTTGMEVGG